ncbi:MAG: fumarate reductase subunit D [Myxococcota bacterium]|jgi:fumarate reductase subunit D|nr:fumarate reductase subunit D [Myxococcota bacterium]
MKTFLLKIEPVIWLLFGQGIMIGTMLMTGWILVVGLLLPLGVIDPEALSYERAHMLGSNIIGKLVLAALLVLPLWKGAHHVRSISVDLGGGDRDSLVGSVVYLIATIGSVLAILAVVRL